MFDPHRRLSFFFYFGFLFYPPRGVEVLKTDQMLDISEKGLGSLKPLCSASPSLLNLHPLLQLLINLSFSHLTYGL